MQNSPRLGGGSVGKSDRVVWLIWLITRLAVLAFLFGPESRVVGDVVYFTYSMQDIPIVGLATTMREYPLPAVGAVAVPWTLAGLLGSSALFGPLIVAFGLSIDAAYTALLARTNGSGRRSALVVWLAAVPALGGLTYARFDLIPGILVGCVVLVAATRPRVAAVLLAVATSIKLWPVLLIPTVGFRTPSRWRYHVTVVFVGFVAAGGTVVLAGWGRLVSPLVYQSDRGLQIESVLATPVMAARLVSPDTWTVYYSKYKAYEISGAFVTPLERLADVASLALVVGLALVWIELWRRSLPVSSETMVWMCLAAVTGFMTVSKVLSPQYFLWLSPAAAGALVATGTAPALKRWSGVVVTVSLLTHLLYPWLYRDLVLGERWITVAVLVLVLRNAMVVWLFVEALRCTFRTLARSHAEQAEPAVETPISPGSR